MPGMNSKAAVPAAGVSVAQLETVAKTAIAASVRLLSQQLLIGASRPSNIDDETCRRDNNGSKDSCC